ncbi:polysaccharide lyase family 4 protein [Nemania sp. FL0916]|nr:polysaccharide lyase family 4 protein [Nemania sp. FL0916]
MAWLRSKLLLFAALLRASAALLNATETSTQFVLQNDRLYVAVDKANGQVVDVTLDSQDLLGPVSGNTGKGPYVDCSCIPSGAWTPGGSGSAKVQLIKGVDGTSTAYAGVRMSDTYKPTNQTIEQYWFLRDGETGLHLFTRVTYFNDTAPFLRDLGELRTLFRPNTNLWTHLSGSADNYAPIPSKDAYADEVVVQDASWYLGNTPDDAYVEQYSDYFTKYTFAELWRDHKAHGQYSDGTTSVDGNTYGAWLVHNTRETYYGGPLHYDLVVDGIVYNYLVSGHYGAPVPNMTHGFDRTWGPQYYHFNKGTPNTSLAELRADAEQFADANWNADFYDSIAAAGHVPNYAPSSQRATFLATVQLPKGAKRPLAVLSENGSDFQLNVFDTKSLQYWADVDVDGTVTIPRVKAGTYRLTVFADGVFGWFIRDDVVVSANTNKLEFVWEPEAAGTEIWRIGTPDKSAGEYLHGFARDESKPLAPAQHRIYWGSYDFAADFPHGVDYTVGTSSAARDINYVHWSWFPGFANYEHPEPVYDNVNNWTIRFVLTGEELEGAREATLTVALAGAHTANGNNKWTPLPDEEFSYVPYTVAVNGKDVETWIIPPVRSGSCAVRSGVICQNFEHRFVFDAALLRGGDEENQIVLSLPYNATDTETSMLPGVIYVQYDAIRFELS